MPALLGTLWNTLLYNPLLQALVFFYKITGNFGLAIIALTILIRGILVPLTLPALKSAKKMQDLKPHLDKLKEKHGSDKMRLQQEQLKLYKENGVNPAAGCLPYLLQFLVLIAMYNVFITFIKNGKIDGTLINMNFLWFNLSRPDKTYLLPVVAGITQFIMSLMMIPKEIKLEKHLKTIDEKKDKKKDEDMSVTLNKQMMFMMPAMTVFIGISLPSGLALYWIITTVFSIIQQYFTTGLGSLEKYLLFIKNKTQGLSKKN